MQAVRDDVREIDNFEWDLLKQDFPGVPLKHFVDNFGRFGPIQHDSDCPTPSHESFFCELNGERFGSRLETFEPTECPAFPKVWNQWHVELDVKSLAKMPLKTFFKVDLTNFAKDPAPMQPKQTKNLVNHSTYLVGPNKVVIFQRSEGREYIFADRFAPEILFVFTQSVQPGIEQETDPRRKLSMLTTHLEIKGRLHIMKSLALLKGKISTGVRKSFGEKFS